MKLGYQRKNHLKSKIIIDQLFSKGKVITKPPFRLIYLDVPDSNFTGIQTLVSVPKRRFKLAVTRNKIRRKISESYRVNSADFQETILLNKKHLALGFVYIGRKELEFEEAERKMVSILRILTSKIKGLENEE